MLVLHIQTQIVDFKWSVELAHAIKIELN